MRVEYRVLGPLEVLLDGEPVAVPAGRCRVLLATLLLRANEFVSVDDLVERLWEGEPPAVGRVHKTLQMVVTRLRRSLGEANCIRTSSGGYMAKVPPERLDLARFRALTAQGEFRPALELWRGPALGNVESESLHRDDVPPLLEEQMVALERRIDQDLSRASQTLVPELRSLVRRFPLRETFWAQLMLALHGSNQQAEALRIYQEIRDLLANELGVDPGQRLRDAHQRVLSGEVPSVAVPRQLPAGVPHFVGRHRELAKLTEMLATRAEEPVLISAINGIGGVGKTALALAWAHQVADRFPDGQLYVNLRGFDTRAEPVDPLAVARDFLRALGIDRIPQSEDALVAAYRSALAQRRVLVVLDNARDVEQVRPLLPGGAANLVLITSRNRLGGLAVREGAQPVALDALDEKTAIELLTERIGAGKAEAEREAVKRLVARCAGLPLALGIVAARAAYGDSLTSLADEMEEERLEALDFDDPATGVRAVFGWSLRSVSAAAVRVFVLLGLHPGPDFTVAAAASLAALAPTMARRALNELVTASLLTRVGAGRFGMHDLLRDYAAERAAQLPDQTEALRGMHDHYLYTSLHAWRWLASDSDRPEVRKPVEHAVVEPPGDLRAANEWFVVEHEVLLRIVGHALAAGMDDLAWQLVSTMHLSILRRGYIALAESIESQALDAVRRVGDAWGEARTHRNLAAVYLATRSLRQGEHHLREALKLEIAHGNVVSESNITRGLVQVFQYEGRYAEAVELLLAIVPKLSRLPELEQAHHSASLGTTYHQMGEQALALQLCERARDQYQALEGVPPSVPVCATLEALAAIYLKLGRHAEAVTCYRESIELLRVMRSVHDLAHALLLLAQVLIDADQRDEAMACVREAEDLLGDRTDVQSEIVRKELVSVANQMK